MADDDEKRRDTDREVIEPVARDDRAGDFGEQKSSTFPVPVTPLDPGHRSAVPSLLVLTGRQMGQVFSLRGRLVRVGRAEDAELCIRDSSISRYHIEVHRDDLGRVRIRDLGSTNGSFVNGQRIKEVALEPGDRIQLGQATVLKLEYHGKLEDQFHSHLYDAGTRDALTGLFNRRYLDQNLDRDFKLAVRHAEHVSLIRISVDGFVEPLDGDQAHARDLVMRRLADIVRDRVRDSDLVARFGDNEFVLLLRHTDVQGAEALANSLLNRTQTEKVHYADMDVDMKVSLGLATIRHDAAMTADELLRHAGQALKKARNAGGGSVEVHGG